MIRMVDGNHRHATRRDPLRTEQPSGERGWVIGASGDALGTIRPAVDPEPAGTVIVRRSEAADRGDLNNGWSAEELADATSVELVGGDATHIWGLPPISPIDLPGSVRQVLRFHTAHSPFAYRPLSFDLAIRDGELLTQTSRGTCDLAVRAEWADVVTWLVRPELLFADAFGSAIRLRGDLAVLSLFEGAVWQISSQLRTEPGVLVRWGQSWPSAIGRSALRQLVAPSDDAAACGTDPSR
jgi:hypothetical protein